jgi:hypothetical protein
MTMHECGRATARRVAHSPALRAKRGLSSDGWRRSRPAWWITIAPCFRRRDVRRVALVPAPDWITKATPKHHGPEPPVQPRPAQATRVTVTEDALMVDLMDWRSISVPQGRLDAWAERVITGRSLEEVLG